MNNFEFQNPTKLIFGEGTIAKLAKNIDKNKKILMTCGGGSIKKNGVYDQVKEALAGYDVTEFWGIEANPDYATLMKAVEICKTQNIDLLLAVGGGSVIDGTKFIAAGSLYEGDPWDFLSGAATIQKALPLAAVLTLPATGSEMNGNAVISRRETGEKLAFGSKATYPQFSILDPNALRSLPQRQIANGIVDTYIHTFEQYMTFDNKTMVMDRWAEGLLQTLITLAPSLIAGNADYQTYANYMLTATMGLNGFVAMGCVEDWSTHSIGHELTAMHGLDHGVTLAIVWPGVARVMKEYKMDKLVQYGERVWGITEGTNEERAEKAIQATEEFFKSVGMKIKLSDHNIGQETIQRIVQRFKERGWTLGEFGRVTPEKTEEILNAVL
ncbi:MAG: iron-containing alcohol dehydrogenase [Marinifilaceae bacterium]|nr:iron-containing alcohol dehydrogenase [Marinifilaceae bacterium]